MISRLAICLSNWKKKYMHRSRPNPSYSRFEILSNFDKIWIRNNPSMFLQPSNLNVVSVLAWFSKWPTSTQTNHQNIYRNAGILSIEKTLSLKWSGKQVEFIKGINIWELLALKVHCEYSDLMEQHRNNLTGCAGLILSPRWHNSGELKVFFWESFQA